MNELKSEPSSCKYEINIDGTCEKHNYMMRFFIIINQRKMRFDFINSFNTEMKKVNRIKVSW